MNEFLQRLKQRKLVQWAIAYVAAAFALLQGIDIVAQQFGWPEGVRRGITLGLVVGFFVTLVLAWYHGERGAQRVTGTELLIISLVLALGGGFLWRFVATRSSGSEIVFTPNDHKTEVASTIPKKSIAVLPFENLSEDKGNAYFASGMQEMILTKLAAIGDLKVISRTSTEQYKSRPDDLKTVARQLGVATILEGSVQKAGEQVLINVQLIDAVNDQHLWAEAYPRTLDNIFGVEGEVAEKVASALKARLDPEESARVASVPTRNGAALELYLKGADLLGRLQRSVVSDPVTTGREARDLFQRATAADPDFAIAYCSWSYLESYLHWYGVDDSPEVIERAKASANKALALQPDLPQAHFAMGYYHYWSSRLSGGARRVRDCAKRHA